MQQADSLKSLALKVLREAAQGAAEKEACPTAVLLERACGTVKNLGQSVGQVVEKALSVPARVRGQDAVIETAQVDICWHCHGKKVCRCALCGVRGPAMTWAKGQCGACLGTGYLTWPVKVQ